MGCRLQPKLILISKYKDLTVAECAMIGGLAKAPSKDSPKINPDRALARRGYVLKRMLEDGYIDSIRIRYLPMQKKPRLVTRQNPHSKVAADFVEQVRGYVDQEVRYWTLSIRRG